MEAFHAQVSIGRLLNVTWKENVRNETTTETTGHEVMEATVKKILMTLVWPRATHGRLHAEERNKRNIGFLSTTRDIKTSLGVNTSGETLDI